MTERQSREIRVLIADDHPIFREGLAKVISRDARLHIVAQAENGDEAVAHLTELRPDVAVLDLDMPERDGFAVTRAAQQAKLAVKVIILTSHNNEALFHSALDLGVAGYVLKDGAINEIVGAIRAVANGRHYFSPELSTYLLNRANRPASLAEPKPTANDLPPAGAVGGSRRKFEPRSDPHISHYRVLKKLGVGGMGEVYLAEDLTLGRQVAVKVLSHELTDNPEHLRRFEREARAASALNHPNILTVYEIGEADGAHFIATEFIEGESLSQRMKRGAMGLLEVLDIGIQIASALAAAHEARIVHRDIKRDNIMVREDHLVKVLDFGLAKLVQQEAHELDSEGITKALHKTTPGVVMGTAEYMSPEQARGHEVDERTDIWSLGVVLYRMVTGNTPFSGETISDVIASILKTDPPPLINEAEPVPRELEQIISKALRKNREDRYQHIKDLLIDLKGCKQELEFAAKLERSLPPGKTGKQNLRQTASAAAVETHSATDIHTSSSAEYIVSEIKRHKLGATALVVLFGLAALGVFAYSRYFAGSDRTGIDSIAVLPFANDTGNSEMEYVSDGLSESLINNLSQLPGLKVIARSSAFRYKGRNFNAEEVAYALGVKSILTGRVLRYGENLQISVELMDARDKTQVWGGHYNRSGRDLMAVQQEIAQDISRNLRLRLSSLELSRVGNLHTANAEAYELYLKGRFYWNKRTGESLKKSLEYFNQSIEKDPSYALAYVGLADAYIVIPYFSVGTAQDSYPKAKAAARRALEIDDRLAEAHTAMAAVLMNYDWNLPESNREFERAIELNPNYATAHHWYARENLIIMGQFDRALAEMRRAQELDPLSLIINANLGKAYFNARRYDEAIQQLRKTVELDQSFFVAHHYLGSAYAMKGNSSEALAEYQKARQLNPDDPHVVALLARLYAISGEKDEALRTLAQLQSMARERYVADYSIALVYAALGEKDQAFELLEKSYRDHTVDMLTLYYDPLIDNLRSDPRFADLQRRVGLK
ncbi:MAG: protein kinase [Acidobacteriota bacterium]|nr:protein kinase [Acidobacteriota bacterium]